MHPLWAPKLPVKAASAPGPEDAIASGDISEAGNIGFQCWRNVTKRAISCLSPEGEFARFTFSRGWAYLANIERDPQGAPVQWSTRLKELYRHAWVVYAKTPLGGPAQTLEYLSRYTHRTAIGNERIKAVTPSEVVFTVRADEHGGKRIERLAAGEFIRRFLLHVLPTGIKRIRHYGVLASACKTDKLGVARQALAMPCANSAAQESAQAFMARVAKIDAMQCPCCKAHQLKVVATLAGCERLPEPGSGTPCQPRGPP